MPKHVALSREAMEGDYRQSSATRKISIPTNYVNTETTSRNRSQHTAWGHGTSIRTMDGHSSSWKTTPFRFPCDVESIIPTIPPMSEQSNFANSTAISLLISTAMSVGMTLGQLSNRLSEAPLLSQVLSTKASYSSKLTLSASLFEVESRALLKRSMLLAGFEEEDVLEGSARHIQVAVAIHNEERQRLENIMLSKMRACGSVEELVRDSSPKCSNQSTAGSRTSTPSFPSGGSTSATTKRRLCEPTRRRRRRHMHRRGKCGHKAILHRPPGKPAHIDFVVGDTIECFEGIKPVGPSGEGAMWPSGILCEEIACQEDPVPQDVVCGSSLDESDSAKAIHQHRRPRNLSLSDIDFLGPEGSADFLLPHGDDDVLLGLLKLCATETVRATEDT